MIHAIGLSILPDAFLSAGLVTQLLIASTILTFIVWMIDHSSMELSDEAAVPIPSGRIAACSPFFRRRLDFLKWGFKVTGQRIVRFTLWQHKVFALSGEAGRQFFFSTRGFNLNQGHQYLNGSIPLIPGVTTNIPQKKVHLIYKNIVLLQKDPALQQDIPIVLKDISRMMKSWGPAGTFNPHEKITEIVFQITLRVLACDELADNPAAISQLRQLFDRLDHSTTPLAILLPWFPSPALLRKYFATKKIFSIISDAVRIRENGGMVKRVDTLQILMELGESRTLVVGFMMGLIVAGARATGITATWLLTYLAHDPHWRDLARKEVFGLLAVHTAFDPTTPISLSSISDLLSEVPLASWENSTPVLDKLIRETLRLAQPHTAMRKNMGPDVYFDGKIVPSGSYAVYSFADVHLDESIYPDPWRFDPDRPEPKATMGWVGWGGGKNICQGTRLAKLELKLLIGMLLASYDFEAIDKAGKAVTTVPRPDWNDHLNCLPEGGPVEVRYKCN